jgi:hypothetical protein
MEMLRSIVSQKADPEQCYFYIDDEKTVRLDKLLSLPNSFEVKRAKLTEKEKQEKQKREAIELYYNSGLQREEQDESGSQDSEAKHQSYLLENFFTLRDRLEVGQPDLKKSDQAAFDEFLAQIKRFNKKLDLSLNYFLNEDKDDPKQRSSAKVDNEIEQKIKQIKDKIEQEKIKKEEVVISKLLGNELELLEAEFLKGADRDASVIEGFLAKLRGFKHLNPGLKSLILGNAQYRRFSRNDVLYRQGEEGHHYFLMLKGSVSLLSNRADFGNFDLYLKSYYDGDFFGEQP